MTQPKVHIKVFITKTNHFRVKINNQIDPPYEVSIGGENWKAGVGIQFKDIIFDKIRTMLSSLNSEFMRIQ